MTAISLSDETFIVAAPAQVASAISVADRWRYWWPALTLTVYEDRGVKGVRWTVTGELVGSAELWVEPHLDGVILHYFLRVDPAVPGQPSTARSQHHSPRQRRALARMERRYATSWKAKVWALKDELEQR